MSAALAVSTPLPWRPAAPLSPPSARLGFVFSAPFGHVPEAFRLRYRLQGFDPDWRVARAERSRTYQSVPPGRYTFEVEASDEEGRYSGKPLAVPVEVEARLAGPLAFAATTLALSTLGFSAAVHGAAAVAIDHVYDDPTLVPRVVPTLEVMS